MDGGVGTADYEARSGGRSLLKRKGYYYRKVYYSVVTGDLYRKRKRKGRGGPLDGRTSADQRVEGGAVSSSNGKKTVTNCRSEKGHRARALSGKISEKRRRSRNRESSLSRETLELSSPH